MVELKLGVNHEPAQRGERQSHGMWSELRKKSYGDEIWRES
jgi:hypothetical protein